LDFTVDRTVLEQFLDLLHKVTRKLATKDIIRDRISRDKFLSVLDLDKTCISDHGFHRNYIFSKVHPIYRGILLKLATYFKSNLFAPVFWKEFPSYRLCRNHVDNNRST